MKTLIIKTAILVIAFALFLILCAGIEKLAMAIPFPVMVVAIILIASASILSVK